MVLVGLCLVQIYKNNFAVVRFGDRITSLARRFPFPPTGYLTPKQKCILLAQNVFFRAPVPLIRAALNGSPAHEKKRSTSVERFLLWCDPDRIRTCDPQLRRLLLYPAELPDQSN